jgi:hypothetical protein
VRFHKSPCLILSLHLLYCPTFTPPHLTTTTTTTLPRLTLRFSFLVRHDEDDANLSRTLYQLEEQMNFEELDYFYIEWGKSGLVIDVVSNDEDVGSEDVGDDDHDVSTPSIQQKPLSDRHYKLVLARRSARKSQKWTLDDENRLSNLSTNLNNVPYLSGWVCDDGFLSVKNSSGHLLTLSKKCCGAARCELLRITPGVKAYFKAAIPSEKPDMAHLRQRWRVVCEFDSFMDDVTDVFNSMKVSPPARPPVFFPAFLPVVPVAVAAFAYISMFCSFPRPPHTTASTLQNTQADVCPLSEAQSARTGLHPASFVVPLPDQGGESGFRGFGKLSDVHPAAIDLSAETVSKRSRRKVRRWGGGRADGCLKAKWYRLVCTTVVARSLSFFARPRRLN